eukprot:NODE_6200_length_646_cov_20.247906_g5271_i0.p2 GENE.NODE_6200_length_646_cov_20.247906_g5271_i0~~NODE_6200_length_646_cov_20.247906_g5271_i0.p2  ORF type:complete len:73 (+),score=18.54 NODE_6200_length_646_cov_20.247906_g5271_i0:260-478(+)
MCRLRSCFLRYVWPPRSLPPLQVDFRDYYACPVYKTQERGPGYVCTAHLKTRAPARKWIIGGVALLMDVSEK